MPDRPSPPILEFLNARDFLLRHRLDYLTAYAGFQWPRLDQFNWALDYFDPLAQDNHRPALQLLDESGVATVRTFAQLSAQSNQVANFLRRTGVRRGDRILVMLANEVPLIGFAGSPFTLACYMIEGRGGTEFLTVKRMLYARPQLLHAILDTNARAVAAYLDAQIEAGVQAIMLFDTWGGILSGSAFQEFSLRYIEQVLSQVRHSHDGFPVPRIVFTKGGGQWLESLAGTGADALGVDWTTDLAGARARVGRRVALQGNLDPAVLLGSTDAIQREAEAVLDSFGVGPGHVFNLGHGVLPQTPPENVAALVEAVHTLSRRNH